MFLQEVRQHLEKLNHFKTIELKKYYEIGYNRKYVSKLIVITDLSINYREQLIESLAGAVLLDCLNNKVNKLYLITPSDSVTYEEKTDEVIARLCYSYEGM